MEENIFPKMIPLFAWMTSDKEEIKKVKETNIFQKSTERGNLYSNI